jgi:hypothetical protein
MLKLTIDRADIIKYGAIMISVFPGAAKDLKLTNSTEEDFFGKLDLNDKTLELTINDEIVDRFMMRVAPMLIAAKNFNQSIAMDMEEVKNRWDAAHQPVKEEKPVMTKKEIKRQIKKSLSDGDMESARERMAKLHDTVKKTEETKNK